MRLVEGVARIDDVAAFVGDLEAVGEAHGVTVQAFDARMIVDRTHLERAVELADRAIERGENVARDRGVEIMLYAAGRRQIDRAIELGVTDGRVPVVVVVDGAEEDAAVPAVRGCLDEGTPTLSDYDEARVRDFFDVTDRELAAVDGDLADLVHERVALLAVER